MLIEMSRVTANVYPRALRFLLWELVFMHSGSVFMNIVHSGRKNAPEIFTGDYSPSCLVVSASWGAFREGTGPHSLKDFRFAVQDDKKNPEDEKMPAGDKMKVPGKGKKQGQKREGLPQGPEKKPIIDPRD